MGRCNALSQVAKPTINSSLCRDSMQVFLDLLFLLEVLFIPLYRSLRVLGIFWDFLHDLVILKLLFLSREGRMKLREADKIMRKTV